MRFRVTDRPAYGKAAVLAGLMIAPLPYARAQVAASKNDSSVSLYGGERFGGSATDSTSNSSISLQNGSSFAVAVDIGLDPNRQIELFYSHQTTAVTSGALSSQAKSIGLILYNYHLGGTVFIEELGRGPYVMGGIGGTTAKPDRNGLSSETFFSGNLGAGWMVPLGAHIGLRFEARGYGILLKNNSAIFCGGTAGCTISIKGSGLFEGEVLAGLTVRF
jgi:hypothetical protein